jgi:hypothetical protein
MKKWNFGRMGKWKDGIVEKWKDGKMGNWNGEIVEYWKIGSFGMWEFWNNGKWGNGRME